MLLLGAAKEVGSSRSKGPYLECSLGPDGGGDLECSLGLDGGGDLECFVGPDGSDDPQCFMGKVQDANTQTGNSFDETAELKKKIDCQAKVIKDLQQTVQNLTMKIKHSCQPSRFGRDTHDINTPVPSPARLHQLSRQTVIWIDSTSYAS